MALNFDSAYHLCQLVHPLLKASGMGSIVFISSYAGMVSLGTGTVYAASKGELFTILIRQFLLLLMVNWNIKFEQGHWAFPVSDLIFSCNQSADKKSGLWMGKRQHKEQLCCSWDYQNLSCRACNILSSYFCFLLDAFCPTECFSIGLLD